jgi:hypothetical protein
VGWELRQALATNGSSWGYFAKVIESIRTEASKPKPLAGGPKPARRSTSGIIEGGRLFVEKMRKEQEAEQRAVENSAVVSAMLQQGDK